MISTFCLPKTLRRNWNLCNHCLVQQSCCRIGTLAKSKEPMLHRTLQRLAQAPNLSASIQRRNHPYNHCWKEHFPKYQGKDCTSSRTNIERSRYLKFCSKSWCSFTLKYSTYPARTFGLMPNLSPRVIASATATISMAKAKLLQILAAWPVAM